MALEKIETVQRSDPETELRKSIVRRTIVDVTAQVGGALIGGMGLEWMADPNNKETIKTVFKKARDIALQRTGVLDENFQIISGQEEYTHY